MVADNRVINEVQGVVSCVSGTGSGLKLAGSEAWINISKYASVTVPPKGSVVVLGLDKSGYIREITTEAKQGSNLEHPEAKDLSNLDTPPADRETRIVRMNAITNAVGILCTGGVVDVAEVLKVAERLEGWVTR